MEDRWVGDWLCVFVVIYKNVITLNVGEGDDERGVWVRGSIFRKVVESVVDGDVCCNRINVRASP